MSKYAYWEEAGELTPYAFSWEPACILFFGQMSWDYQYRYNWDFVRNWRDNNGLVWC